MMYADLAFKDRYSILAINLKGRMIQIHVPFKVQVIQPVKQLDPGGWVLVEEVRQDAVDLLLYRIFDRWYPYYHFELVITF